MNIRVTPTKFIEYASISFTDGKTGQPKTVPVIKFIGEAQVPDSTGAFPPAPEEARFTIWPQGGGLPTLESFEAGTPVVAILAKDAGFGSDGKRRFTIKPGPNTAVTMTEAQVLDVVSGDAPASAPGYTPKTPAAGVVASTGSAKASRMSAIDATIMVMRFQEGILRAADIMGLDMPVSEAATHARQLVIGVDRGLSAAPGDDYSTGLEAQLLKAALPGDDTEVHDTEIPF